MVNRENKLLDHCFFLNRIEMVGFILKIYEKDRLRKKKSTKKLNDFNNTGNKEFDSQMVVNRILTNIVNRAFKGFDVDTQASRIDYKTLKREKKVSRFYLVLFVTLNACTKVELCHRKCFYE